MRHLIGRYLETSVAAPVALFPRLFGWDAGVTERVAAEMVADGTVEQVRMLGGPGLTARQKVSPDGEIWIVASR